MKYLLLIFLIISTYAKADFYSGNDLYNGIRELKKALNAEDSNQLEAGRALGYLNSTYESFLVLNGSLFRGKICIPKIIPTEQFIDIQYSYLQKYPEKRHDAAVVLIHLALIDAFPCPKK